MFTIVIDNREQKPWSFPEWQPVTWGTIKTGDYAIQGDEMNFAIERKSLDDFLCTISSGWDRFNREIERMEKQKFPAKVVIVESDLKHCFFYNSNCGVIQPNHSHHKLQPQFVASRIADLTYRGVSVLFCCNPDIAAGICYKILENRFFLGIINNGND